MTSNKLHLVCTPSTQHCCHRMSTQSFALISSSSSLTRSCNGWQYFVDFYRPRVQTQCYDMVILLQIRRLWIFLILFSIICCDQLPANIKLSSPKSTENRKGKFLVDEVENAKRKGKAVSVDQSAEKTSETSNDSRLSTLDIFAGCGGLSEGLEKSGSFGPY